jgi:hypothetical protein
MSWRQLNCLSQYLHWSEPQLFNVELSDLDIPEEHLVEVFGHLRRLNRVQRSVLSGVGHSWLRPRLCPRLPLHRRGRRKQRGYQSRSSDHPPSPFDLTVRLMRAPDRIRYTDASSSAPTITATSPSPQWSRPASFASSRQAKKFLLGWRQRNDDLV